MSFIVNSGYFKICNSLLNLGSCTRVQWWNIKNGKGTKKIFWDFDYTKDANYLKSPFPGMMSSGEWWVSPRLVTIAEPPSLIKRSLVSLFVSNWPIGGSQSSRTTCPPTSHNLYTFSIIVQKILHTLWKNITTFVGYFPPFLLFQNWRE